MSGLRPRSSPHTLLSLPLKPAKGFPWVAADTGLGQKERSIPTVPGKDKCTHPTEPSCHILGLTVVFNLILSLLLSLPYLLSSTCIPQPEFSPSSVFPSPGENAFNAWEPVRS